MAQTHSAKKISKPKGLNKLKGFSQTIFIYLLIGLATLLIVASFNPQEPKTNEIAISQVISDIKDQKIYKLTVEGDKILLDYKDTEDQTARKESGESIYKIIESAGVDPKLVIIEIKDLSWQQTWVAVASALLPVLVMVVLFFFLFRNAREGAQGIFAFGQSKAKIFNKDAPQVKFTDVAGVDEAKRELSEIVDFLKNPSKYTALGARIPKGVLLIGPAGVGKTLLARAVAGEANVPFFSIAGSEFMEMLVGVGAARVRDMFGTAKKNSPSIIFIDEVESIGRMRGMGISGGHDEREQTLNQILVEMDGFTPSDRVIVMAATNRPDLLDPALVRPGRFDRRVLLSLPDLEERKALITLHMKGKPFTKDVDVERLARRTVGFSGADLANMLNEAAILAARDGKTAIDVKDLEEAATKEKMGPARKRMQSENDRKLAAYHEAGHAVVGHFLPGVDPVHRISIISRGASGGHTMFPPTEDRSNETKSRLIQQIATALGGQVAEEIFFKDISTGASSDIESATAIAKAMVTQYGMSELGPINITPASGSQWRGIDDGGSISPTLHDAVDKQIKKLIDKGQQTAFELARKHKSKLEAVAKALLEKETLESDEFEKIVGLKKSA
jgi:cell division protease FtsH